MGLLDFILLRLTDGAFLIMSLFLFTPIYIVSRLMSSMDADDLRSNVSGCCMFLVTAIYILLTLAGSSLGAQMSGFFDWASLIISAGLAAMVWTWLASYLVYGIDRLIFARKTA